MSMEREPGVGQRARRREADRNAALEAVLDPDETVVARGVVIVTDRRVLLAWDGPFGWHGDGVAFDEVRGWALGRLHDERPVVRLEHPTHLRIEHVPAHRLLWFAWGNAEGSVAHDDTTLTFASARDACARALIERLHGLNVPRREDFVVRVPGSREERLRRTRGVLFRTP